MYCSSGKTLRIPRLRKKLEQKEFAVNPFTSGARFIRSVKNQRMAGSSWMDSFRVARNRNTLAAARREARVARDAVNANSRQLQVAQSNQATLKPKAETSGDIANVNAYKNNEKTITNLTNEQPALNQQLENKLNNVETISNSNKDLGFGVKDAKDKKFWNDKRAAQDNVGKQLQAEEQAAVKAQQEAAKVQQQQPQQTQPTTNPNPNPQPTQQTQTPAADVNTTTATTNTTPDATNTGMSGWKKAGIGAGIVGASALGYGAYKINQLDNSVSS